MLGGVVGYLRMGGGEKRRGGAILSLVAIGGISGDLRIGEGKGEISVRYHCGGWPAEVNSCFLNSYMVYL
jgi:hypothetical protein